MRSLLAILLVLLACSTVVAQTGADDDPPPSIAAEEQAAGGGVPEVVRQTARLAEQVLASDAARDRTPWELWLTGSTVAILIVALVTLGLATRRRSLTPEFTRTYLIVLIIFAALFLITAGYSDQQAAPVYGLLGSIIGYIFGRGDQVAARSATNTEESTATPRSEG